MSLTPQSIIPGTGLSVLETQRVVTVAGYISLASLAWLIYDYIIYLHEEVAFVWKTRWSLTKVLYILNRYLTVVVALVQCSILFANMNMDTAQCNAVGRFVEVMIFVLTVIMGGILTLRVWYLWAHNRMVQHLTLAVFGAILLIGIALVGHNAANSAVSDTRAELQAILDTLKTSDPLYYTIHTVYCSQGSTNAGVAGKQWENTLLVLVYQSVLFALTIFRVSSPERRRAMRSTPLMTRLVRDGSFFYVVGFSCLVFALLITIIGQPAIQIPLLMSNFTNPALSISTSHLVLSLRSLAATLSHDPHFLLNEAEMSRLYKLHGIRPGHTEGEFFVDVGLPSPSRSEWERPDHIRLSRLSAQGLPVLSRVGVFDGRNQPSDTPGDGYHMEELAEESVGHTDQSHDQDLQTSESFLVM